MPTNRVYRIAVIPGDGIGKEVVPEGIRVLDAAGERFGLRFRWDHLDWSCERYAQPGAMKSGMEVFKAFGQDAKDNAEFAKTKLTMPMLVLGGEKSGGDFLISQAKLVADNVDGVLVTGSGHWLVDEAPGQVIPKLVAFFGK